MLVVVVVVVVGNGPPIGSLPRDPIFFIVVHFVSLFFGACFFLYGLSHALAVVLLEELTDKLVRLVCSCLFSYTGPMVWAFCDRNACKQTGKWGACGHGPYGLGFLWPKCL